MLDVLGLFEELTRVIAARVFNVVRWHYRGRLLTLQQSPESCCQKDIVGFVSEDFFFAEFAQSLAFESHRGYYGFFRFSLYGFSLDALSAHTTG